MIVTLTGGNSFAIITKLNQLIADFVDKHGDLALERIDGQETNFQNINEAFNGLPFLSDKKMVVLREASTNKEFTEKFEQLFNKLPDSTDVILVEPKLDKRLSFYKFLKKNTEFQEFNDLDINSLTSWIVKEVQQSGGKISNGDARYLVERVGTNQLMLSNDLQKLLLNNKEISRTTIDLLTDETPQSTIFQLLEAAFAGNKNKTISLYAEQRALKVEPQQIVAMLAWQLHVLAVIKAAGNRSADEIAKDAKLNPFVVRKSQGIARNLSISEIKNLISKLIDIDIKSKSINIDLDEALQNYLLKLAY